jgi:hypothetical protein
MVFRKQDKSFGGAETSSSFWLLSFVFNNEITLGESEPE